MKRKLIFCLTMVLAVALIFTLAVGCTNEDEGSDVDNPGIDTPTDEPTSNPEVNPDGDTDEGDTGTGEGEDGDAGTGTDDETAE